MIRVGIIGAAGYTGGELLRLLVNHPKAEITYAYSQSQSNKPIAEVHRDMFTTSLVFCSEIHFDIDALFICSGHGRARTFMQDHPVPDHVMVIDLSQDFRIQGGHSFVYGLPELNRSQIRSANRVANPGCFATAIQLALLPSAHEKWIKTDVHVHAITGSTGAGQSPSATSHFSWRNNNISVYKAFAHQHLAEIKQSLGQLQPDHQHDLHFIPVRGNFTRGIFASIYWETELKEEEIKQRYESYYATHPFVQISNLNPDLKQVINSNYCLLHITKHGKMVHIISLIDNLVKGASGQAMQNLNIMFDLPESTGLQLKSSIY